LAKHGLTTAVKEVVDEATGEIKEENVTTAKRGKKPVQ